MGNTTANLSRSEFACSDKCGLADPHPALVMGWQAIADMARRDFAQRPRVAITGPGRCERSNTAAGGAPASRHLPDPRTGYTRAADGYVWFPNHDGSRRIRLPLRRLMAYAEAVPAFAAGGIGVYLDDSGPRAHLDVDRPASARWGKLDGVYTEIEDVLAAADAWEKKHGETWGSPPEEGAST